MTTGFSPLAHRDAHATIRGFIYQVERTILAWLRLDENTIIYCESGEDIDYVPALVQGESRATVVDRLLEQVKYREARPFSLRSPEVVEALANLVRTRDANPGLRIHYRFVTNARPAKEAGVVFPMQLSGLEAWQRIRVGTFTAQDCAATISQVRTIIGDLALQSDDRAEHAGVVRNYLATATDEEVATDLVQSVDWSLGNERAEELAPAITSQLISLEYARSDVEAKHLLDKVFVHLFRVLGTKGEKRLDRASLVRLIQEGTLASVDRQLLETVHAISKGMEERLQIVAEQVSEVRESQRGIQQFALTVQQGIEALVRTSVGSGSEVPLVVRSRPDEPPIRPSTFAPRQDLLELVRSELTSHTWLALVGSSGMGKTLLARLFWDECGKAPTKWISLRGLPHAENLQSHLDEQLLDWLIRLAADEVAPNPRAWSAWGTQQMALALAERAGRNALLVIDDLPNLLMNTMLGERVTAIAVAFVQTGARFITTSQHRLPTSIQERVDAETTELTVPLFLTEDIANLLASAGAPPHVRSDRICRLLLGLTKGHPALVSAAVRHLSKSGWQLNDRVLNDLITGTPLRERRLETRQVVRILVSESGARDLLDRLSIVGAPFDIGMAASVAQTYPAVPSWREHLDDLIGPWVQVLQGSQLEVSALLDEMGVEYLSEDVRRRVHNAIARKHLQAGTIAADDAFQVCIHLSKAGDWGALADVIAQLMISARTPEQARYVDWVTYFFRPGKQWPSSIPISKRVVVRALQVRILMLAGKSTDAFDDDLEGLVAEAMPDEPLVVAFARFQTGPMLELAPAAVAAMRAIQGARALRAAGSSIADPAPFPVEALFWSAIPRIRTRKDIEAVAAIISSLSAEERQAVFSTHPGQEMVVFLADDCYAVEADKDAADRDWNAVLALLDRLERAGELSGAAPLGIAARRARAVVLADNLGKIDEALALLDREPSASDGSLPFVTAFTRASILLAKGRPEAHEAFVNAISLPEAKNYAFLYRDALRRGLEAAGRAGHWNDAREWCVEAIRLALSQTETTPAHEYPALLSELAWIHWSAGDRKRACGAMYGVVRRLTSSTDVETASFKITFRKVGHVLGWLMGTVLGQTPSRLPSGEEYARPATGMMLAASPAIADLPDALPRYLIWSQLGFMASGVGCLRIARLALAEASVHASADGLLVQAAINDVERGPIEVLLGNTAAALECALSSSRGLALAKRLPRGQTLLSNEKPLEYWQTLMRSEQVHAENLHLFFGLFLPEFTKLLGDGADAATGLGAIDGLMSELSRRRSDLVDYPEWERLAGFAKFGFQLSDSRDTILRAIGELQPDDSYGRMALYLALARRNDTPLRDVAAIQAIVLNYINESGVYGRQTISKLSQWIIKFWREVVAKRAFSLRSPDLLRREFAQDHERASLPSRAARVLLAAETVVDATYDTAGRVRLVALSQESLS